MAFPGGRQLPAPSTGALEARLKPKRPSYIEYSDPNDPNGPRFLESIDEPLIQERMTSLVARVDHNNTRTPPTTFEFRYCEARGFYKAGKTMVGVNGRKTFQQMPRTMGVYIDGACRSNGANSARASWGHFYGPGSPHNSYGCLSSELPQTSSRAEIEALLRVLKHLYTTRVLWGEDVSHIWILTDSTYVVNSVNCWLGGWINRRGRKADGRPVAHFAEWTMVQSLISNIAAMNGVQIHIRHVRREQNTGADAMANLALDSVKLTHDAELHTNVNIVFDKNRGFYKLIYFHTDSGTADPHSLNKTIMAVFLAGTFRPDLGTVASIWFGPSSRHNSNWVSRRYNANGSSLESHLRSCWKRTFSISIASGDFGGVDEIVVLTDSQDLFGWVAYQEWENGDFRDERFGDLPETSQSFLRVGRDRGLRLIPRSTNKPAQAAADLCLKRWANNELEL